jgi:AraC-like DNA-binding protein
LTSRTRSPPLEPRAAPPADGDDDAFASLGRENGSRCQTEGDIVKFHAHSPGPPLAGFVENLWSLSDAPSHARERILPAGTLELVINLDEDEFRIYDASASGSPRRFPGAIVSGAYRRPFVIDTREHASVIGVHFAPGGAGPFLGVPPGDLADTHLDLETLWPRRAAELRERLCEARTPATRFHILEHALLARLRRPFARHAAVRAALEHIDRPGVRVAEVARHVGASHRHLIERFTAEVGAPPKLFGRLQRFQRALSVVQRSAAVDWAGLASACGYYDQSHLIKDFHEFAGSSPTDLVRQCTDRVKAGHVALPHPSASNSSNTA